jgi:hypothetical protein
MRSTRCSYMRARWQPRARRKTNWSQSSMLRSTCRRCSFEQMIRLSIFAQCLLTTRGGLLAFKRLSSGLIGWHESHGLIGALNRRHRRRRVPEHDLCRNAQRPVPEPSQPLVPTRISPPCPLMAPAIYLHDEPNGRREHVHDVRSRERHLSSEVHPELSPESSRQSSSSARCNLARCCRARSVSTDWR